MSAGLKFYFDDSHGVLPKKFKLWRLEFQNTRDLNFEFLLDLLLQLFKKLILTHLISLLSNIDLIQSKDPLKYDNLRSIIHDPFYLFLLRFLVIKPNLQLLFLLIFNLHDRNFIQLLNPFWLKFFPFLLKHCLRHLQWFLIPINFPCPEYGAIKHSDGHLD